MNNVYFKNSSLWLHVYATLLSKDESEKMTIKLSRKDKDEMGDYVVNFDNEKYDHLYFHNSLKEKKKTSKIFVGNSNIGCEYKYNRKKKSSLTYIRPKDVKVTGRVDTYVFKDEVNLAYREDEEKRVHVYIPSSYEGNEEYDILYFFDAQNLFSHAGKYTTKNDPYGGWQLDVALDSIYHQYGQKIIVVAIENADKYRSQELFMSPKTFGKLAPLATGDIPDEYFRKGNLDDLSNFMRETVHPFIKNKYKVKEDNIGIGGSSMGGIAAFYCSLKELGFYKYVLSYSPAYGLYDMSAYDEYFPSLKFKKNSKILPKLHIYCGGNDPLEQRLLPPSQAMKNLLVKHGYNEELIYETYDMDKPHNEEAWRLILLDSFSFLLDLK